MTISANPEVVIRQDEIGGAKVRASLSETEKVQERLSAAIKRANLEAAYRQAAAGSEELREATARLEVQSIRTASAIASISGALGPINQGLEVGKKIYAMADGFYRFAAAGAAAAGMRTEFAAFEARLDATQTTLEKTTAKMLASSGAMDAVAKAAEDLSGAFESVEGAGSIMTAAVWLWQAAFYALAWPTLALSEALGGLSDAIGLVSDEAEENTTSFYDMAAAWQAVIDKAEKLRGAVKKSEIAEAIDVGFGAVPQGVVAGLTEQMRLLDSQLGSPIDTSELAQQILDMGAGVDDAEKLITRMGDALYATGGATEAEVKRLGLLSKEIRYLANSEEQLAKVETEAAKVKPQRGGRTSELLTEAELVEGLAKAWTNAKEAFLWTGYLGEQDRLRKRSADFADRVLKAQLDGEEKIHEARLAMAEELAQIERDKAAKAEEDRQAALDSAIANYQAQKGLAIDTARAVGGATAEYLGGAWARAGFEAAFETGLGLANLGTPPFFGFDHFAGAAQLLIAQAFASSNGGKTGSSSSGGGARPAAAAAGNSMLKRPDSRSQATVMGKVQLWFKDRMLAESVAEDAGDVARRGGKRIPAAAVGGGNRRGF